jgi:hypothetical protein
MAFSGFELEVVKMLLGLRHRGGENPAVRIGWQASPARR